MRIGLPAEMRFPAVYDRALGATGLIGAFEPGFIDPIFQPGADTWSGKPMDLRILARFEIVVPGNRDHHSWSIGCIVRAKRNLSRLSIERQCQKTRIIVIKTWSCMFTGESEQRRNRQESAFHRAP